MNSAVQNNNKDDEWIQTLIAEEQKRADEAGVHLLEYMAREDEGILKPVITKTLKHARAHPGECPGDCEFQASLERLKKKYGVDEAYGGKGTETK